MPPRSRRNGAESAGGASGAAEAAAASSSAAAADAVAAAPAAAAAGSKRKAASVKAEQVKQEVSADGDGEEGDSGSKSANRRRQAKRAKHAASDLEAAAAAQAEQAARARPAATQRKAEKRVRVAGAKREEKATEERQLEAFLFGNDDALLDTTLSATSSVVQHNTNTTTQHGANDGAQQDGEDAPAPAFSFEVDTAGAGGEEDGASAAAAAAASKKKQNKKKSGAKSEDGAAAAAAGEDGAEEPAGPQAAWADADDAAENTRLIDLSLAPRLRKLKAHPDERYITGEEYNRRLRALFQELNPGTAAWATAKEDAAGDADITTLLLQSAASGGSGTAGLGGTGREPGGAGRGEALPSTTLDVLRLRDANLADPCASVVSSVRFHPGGQLLMTAGLDKMVRIFQVDGHANAKVQGVWMDDMPVMSAEWLPSRSAPGSSSEIIATGRRQHFYSIDVESGAISRIAGIRGREDKSLERMVVSPCGRWIAVLANDGYTLLLDGRTKQLCGSTKQNGSVRGVSFSADGEHMYTIGSEGALYLWHTASRKCLYRHQDEGNISGTAVAVGGGGLGAEQSNGMYALGSDSGVVNLYNSTQLSNALSHRSSVGSIGGVAACLSASGSAPAPTPVKALMHLTTPVDYLRFNHDSSLLLMASRRKKDALKLVHTASATVFANWPTASTPLHYVSSVDFSPNSGYMAIGNDRGRVLLYRLTHYPRA